MADEKPTETAPPATDPETGVAMDGDFPHNHRLRAEALAKAGKDSDPDGLVSDDLIADASARLERNAAAMKAAEDEAKRRATELRRMTTEQLEATALEEGVDLSGASTNLRRAELIEAHRNATAAPPPVSDEATATNETKGA